MNKLSVFISLILRHKPEVIGIKLDSHGWASVSDLLKGINDSGKYTINQLMLVDIVLKDTKGRYTFNNDKSKIRATQGHSVKIDLDLVPEEPPFNLYHGTDSKFFDAIKKNGLSKMQRHHVHLTASFETAKVVGARRKTKNSSTIIFYIDTRSMELDGIKFYRSENDVWLVDHIDPKYLEVYYDIIIERKERLKELRYH
jgi:putative RNA 2'-phosphotransferase